MSDTLAKRDRVLSVPLRPDELDRVRQIAASQGLATGTWARVALMQLIKAKTT